PRRDCCHVASEVSELPQYILLESVIVGGNLKPLSLGRGGFALGPPGAGPFAPVVGAFAAYFRNEVYAHDASRRAYLLEQALGVCVHGRNGRLLRAFRAYQLRKGPRINALYADDSVFRHVRAEVFLGSPVARVSPVFPYDERFEEWPSRFGV